MSVQVYAEYLVPAGMHQLAHNHALDFTVLKSLVFSTDALDPQSLQISEPITVVRAPHYPVHVYCRIIMYFLGESGCQHSLTTVLRHCTQDYGADVHSYCCRAKAAGH